VEIAAAHGLGAKTAPAGGPSSQGDAESLFAKLEARDQALRLAPEEES